MSLSELEARLGVYIEPALLELALTHPSHSEGDKSKPNYQRLEFLGDAVLGLVVAHLTFRKFENFDEHSLSRITNQIVREKSLAVLATRLEIGPEIKLGRGMGLNSGELLPSILADVFEAIVGALYLTSGFEIAFNFVAELVDEFLEQHELLLEDSDPRTDFEKLARQLNLGPIIYSLVETGPDHLRVFKSTLEVGGQVFSGEGAKKTESKKSAAVAALNHFKK